ncbi:MMPL family transporter [Paenibacillus thermoaerophilus]|uniref:MMPL family transporter n=1 Tax=Paenibacillus thermoaerophilus TaxID=1215385 RepID=A0ABW2V491_9BACL|nr:MMPL family transporter [Paenibacillus thermoaerophilus]TMV16131.1 MMPL family transporter [Paenibacillus thermoaerophilus]
MERWWNVIARYRWMVVVVWVLAAGTATLVFPSIQDTVRRQENTMMPADSESAAARAVLRQLNPDSEAASSAAVVISRDGGLLPGDKDWLRAKSDEWLRRKDELGIVSVLTAFDRPEMEAKFISGDGTTMLMTVDLPKPDYDPATQDTVRALQKEIGDAPQGLSVHLTGSAPISLEYMQSSEEGLKKTEILTVVLVLGILLAVFRSPVAPFVPLVTIALSFLLSAGIVGLAATWGLPVSSFTQSFLIAVLFGAGTDYCILMIHRFREELGRAPDRLEALIRTMRTVGKTVVYSASTVLIAFFLIGFAQFGLYQSAVGVAVGMAATLLAALTLAPALMLILGPRMFWPARIGSGASHGESKLWGRMGSLVAKRPLAVLLATVLALSPLTLLFDGKRSFDDLAEIDPKLGSVVGFRKIEEKFSAGEVFPVTIAVQADKSLRTPEGIAAIEEASDAASRISAVKEVRSVSRPLGERIRELTVSDQLAKTNEGLADIRDGISKVSAGLEDAAAQTENGIGGIRQLQQGLERLAREADGAQNGLRQAASGLRSLEAAAKQSADGAGQLHGVAQSMAADLDSLATSFPELAADPGYQALVAKQRGLAAGLEQSAQGLRQLQDGLSRIAPGVSAAADGLGQMADAQRQASSGVAEMTGKLGGMAGGLREAAGALKQMDGGLGQVLEAQGGIAEQGSRQIEGWYLPASALESEQMKAALDFYMSPDGKTTKIEVVLAINPYSAEAMSYVDEIRSAVRQSLSAAGIEGAVVKASGVTAQYHELQGITEKDFVRTALLVVAGIFVILALMLRSLSAPVYILLSLGLNYFATMGLLEYIFVQWLGYPGLSWTVSFFVFLILVALGVDYSIFLMARFREEYEPGGTAAAMRKAMASTGGVIVSAMFIMAGTFAAFLYSGVDTLVQIGTGIVIGLFLYALVFMGLAVPAIANLLGDGNFLQVGSPRPGAAERMRSSLES